MQAGAVCGSWFGSLVAPQSATPARSQKAHQSAAATAWVSFALKTSSYQRLHSSRSAMARVPGTTAGRSRKSRSASCFCFSVSIGLALLWAVGLSVLLGVVVGGGVVYVNVQPRHVRLRMVVRAGRLCGVNRNDHRGVIFTARNVHGPAVDLQCVNDRQRAVLHDIGARAAFTFARGDLFARLEAFVQVMHFAERVCQFVHRTLVPAIVAACKAFVLGHDFFSCVLIETPSCSNAVASE